MKQQRWLGAAIAALLLVAACGKKSHTDVIQKAQGFIDRAYACKDLACAKQVQDELAAYAGKQQDLDKESAHFLWEEAVVRVDDVVGKLQRAR